ncbi:Capsule polysaccharide export protein KpsC [Nymphon striatum]|nr:Capsule polysaccharide export protein KpsC [Nymphon striatum]
MLKPIISVVIPVYNTARYLEKCLDSVLNQSFKDIEIICVDDLSSDNSHLIIKKYIEKDPRVSLIRHEKNLGQGGARNTGIMAAKANFIASVDSDDSIHLKMLEVLWDASENGEFDIVCCGYTQVDGDGVILNSKVFQSGVIHGENKNIFTLMNPAIWNKLWRKSLFIDNKIFFPHDLYFQDMATIPLLVAKASRIKFVKECLYNYLVREGSVTTTFTAKHIIDYFKVYGILYNSLETMGLINHSLEDLEDYIHEGMEFHSSNLVKSEMKPSEKDEYLRHLLMLKTAFLQTHRNLILKDREELISLLKTATTTEDIIGLSVENLYDLTGGYCMDFRGHGSEDFEFMVRQNLLFGNMPMPDHLIEDKYKPFPFREDYFDWKKYSGFRRLAEAEAFSGEIAGLRAFHIWHPLTVKGWHEVNDGKRITFNKVLSRYLGNELNLLKEDFLSRDKSALCLSDNVSDTGYFLPLRLLGYKLDVLNSKEIIDQTGSNNEIEDKTYDAVFIISLKDKLKFHSLLKQYFQRGISVFVLSEGVIPGSIFFKNLSENTLNFPRTDLVQTEANISSFESFLTYLNDMYKQDNKLLAALIRDESTKVFILIDETEAFYFQKEKSEQFKLYLEELNHLIDEKTEVMFVFWEETVKNLIPFLDVDNLPRNCYAVGSDVHSSSIVRLADVVVSYGAEEGFLGLFLGKPVYFISQSDYAYSIVSVSGLSEALESHEVSGHDSKISKEKMSSLFYWFFSKKYSFYFKSASVWQEQQVIESSFQRVKCSFLNFEGWKKLISSENLKYNYHKSSYLASKLGLYGEEVEISKRKVLVNSLTEKNIRMSKELLDSKIAIQGLVEEGNKFKKKAIGVQQLLLRKEKSLCSLVEEMKIAENQKIKNEEQLSEYEHENRNLIQKCEETQKIIVDTQEKLINLQKDKDEALSMVLEYEKSLSNLEQEKAEKISILQRIGVMSYLFLVWPFMTKRLRLKLYKKPRAFFKDSKHSIAQSMSSKKLSIIIPFRASHDRPYLIERLKSIGGFFNQEEAVEYMLVDSGSDQNIRGEIEHICKESGFRYLFHDSENEVFSIGSARDFGVQYAHGKLVTFLDVDLVPTPDFERRLLELAERIGVMDSPRQFFTLPCLYLTEEGNALFFEEQKEYRHKIFYQGFLHGDNERVQNLAPCSSVMVVNRHHYLSVGGHRAEFKGHGYEDFELIHRLLTIQDIFPRPHSYYHDTKSWNNTTFKGFRSQFSLLGGEALAEGLFTVHLWHPRPPSSGYEANLPKNHANASHFFKKFDQDGLSPYPLRDLTRDIEGKMLFLGSAFSNSAECIREAVPYLGENIYALETDFASQDEENIDIEKFVRFVEYQKINRIIFPNPYGNSIRLGIYKWAKETDFPYYCFDRGALPNSWFFDNKGFNVDSASYSPDLWDKKLSETEIKETEDYVQDLLVHDVQLEKQGERVGADALKVSLRIGNKKVLFVPFQRPSDSVIKYFSGKVDSVAEFAEEIDKVAKQLAAYGWLVVCKKHPLEVEVPELNYATWTPDDTHFIDLLELSDAVALINSGVGVYAAMLGKPCYIFGEAFYQHSEINTKIENTNELTELIVKGGSVNQVVVQRLIHHLVHSVYSFGHTKTRINVEEDGSKRTWKDLTVIVPVRASSSRDTLRCLEYMLQDSLLENYSDRIEFIIVDDGSAANERKKLEARAEELNITYLYLDTISKPFSIGRARNAGAMYAKSTYVMFMDVDLVSYDGFYRDLLNEIKVQELNKYANDFIMVGVIYLTRVGVTEFWGSDRSIRKTQAIQWLLSDNKEYIDKFSTGTSVCLYNRDVFLSNGGNDEQFEEWGYEDLEFNLRMIRESHKYPFPDSICEDYRNFKEIVEYRGWKSIYRLFGDITFQKGIVLFHMWHEVDEELPYMKNGRVRNQTLFEERCKAYHKKTFELPPLPDPYAGKTLLFSKTNAFVWNKSIMPQMGVVHYKEEESLSSASLLEYISDNQIGRVLFQNPYANKHRLGLYNAVKKNNIPYVVAERGALRDSVFYDSNGFNAESTSYDSVNWDHALSDDQCRLVQEYIDNEKTLSVSLEKQDRRQNINSLYASLNIPLDKKILFIPLQRPSDTVIKYFCGKSKSHDDFIKLVQNVAHSIGSDWIVVAKKHPLEDIYPEFENVIFSNANVKDLIELSDYLLLINSGVGLLSLLWGKPVMYFGEVFYGDDRINRKVDNEKDVLNILESGFEPEKETIFRFLNFLIFEFYSFGKFTTAERKWEDGGRMTFTSNIDFYQIRNIGTRNLSIKMSFTELLQESIPHKDYTVSDITLVLCVRLTNNNPWIVERLLSYSEWFSPCPKILIVDFGSSKPFNSQLKDLSRDKGYEYHYIDHSGTFSLSNARNEGFLQTSTDLIFFTDPDFVFERDIFSRLLKISNVTNLNRNSFNRITMPAYHVSREYTERFESQNNCELKEEKLIQWAHHGVYAEYSEVFEYISPYSNSFLCHRNYYDLVGGYSTDFVGHGSEDFEFIIRANLLQGRMPVPMDLETDVYRPGIPDSERQDYRGFRRLAEVEAFSGELHGLRSFHLWHPRAASKGWYENNDMKRKTFNKVIGRYINQQVNLLEEDHLEREQHALCIVSDSSHRGYFLPLRALGYSMDVLFERSQIKQTKEKIINNQYDRVFVHNPYTDKVFQSVIELVRNTSSLELTVIERGALPNSLYYAGDMSYQDSDFVNLTLEKLEAYSQENTLDKSIEKNLIKIVDRLKEGGVTLEKNAGYQETLDSLKVFLDSSEKQVIFIPLQLPYDTAVTLFNVDRPTYESFLESIAEAVATNPDIGFIVKPHPLQKEVHLPEIFNSKASNLYLLKENENVHAAIESVDAVILYNSGVGLLSLFHNKPVFYIGNAYYSCHQHFAKQVDNVSKALEMLQKDSKPKYSKKDVLLFLHWLVHYKYSFFEARDELRELEHRNSHAYQNIQVSILNMDGVSFSLGSISREYDYSSNSYAAARLSLNAEDDHRNYVQNAIKKGFDKRSQLVTWASKDQDEIEKLSKQFQLEKKVWRVEDGFIRSTGLGTDLTAPASLVLDKNGIYYDPSSPSDLELLLQSKVFSPEELIRADNLRKSLLENELSKYNLGSTLNKDFLRSKLSRPDQHVILVPGQVEGDASIKKGCVDVRTNSELIKAVRKQNPEAFLIYKPHPDVVSGNRKGKVDDEVLNKYSDLVLLDSSITDCLNIADEVHTMTSLVGFEGLLRKLKVVCYGLPFYSNWGLTTDIHVLERRARKLGLDELVAATLIDYPLYINWETGEFTTPEVVVEQLKKAIDRQGGKQQNQVFWLKRKLRQLRNIVSGIFFKSGN